MSDDAPVRVAVVLPDVLGTYGDGGNATVLVRRLQWRGLAATTVRATISTGVPDDCDIYVVGGGEDSAQALAARTLIESGALHRAVGHGAVVLGVCAGLQLLGREMTGPDGVSHPGLGLLDVTSAPLPARAVGEVVAAPLLEGLVEPLTGFENHGLGTSLGPGVTPLARVGHGVGNGDADRTEGAVAGRVVGTYLHGPVLPRNPELADLLLSWAVGHELAPLRLPVVEQLRERQIASGQRRR
jgi:CobQ-like glutamine amidotransferase family enzyme